MDASEASWLSDLLLQESEDCNLFRQCHLDNDDAFEFDNLPQSHSCYSETVMNDERPTKQPKIVSSLGPKQRNKAADARDHIMAERKRREKLSQSLIALAALIPGLKKMDKATVLGDAIRYVKELQERLRMLEEEQENKNRDDVVMVKKARDLPRVEARVSEKDVLLRIHCQKQKGVLLKILVEIQNLHLCVVNSSVLPFGDSFLDITIVAQMGTGYDLTINDLVKNLRVATSKFIS